jgi:hypothetical protein
MTTMLTNPAEFPIKIVPTRGGGPRPCTDTAMHGIWRKIRRPFRYPSCRSCRWEVYDVNQAGCLKCGRHHFCHANSVDSTCPLVTCDDRTRVCLITGHVLSEVRHADNEFYDTVSLVEKPRVNNDISGEVHAIVASFLMGDRAKRCREHENAKQYNKLSLHLYRQVRRFKLGNGKHIPCICQLLASAVQQERYWRFIGEASQELVTQCACNITSCILKLQATSGRIPHGTRLQEMVCGMLYMLKHGLVFRDQTLLSCIPEIDKCLPHENKIEAYFGISSKVICMTENEVKLAFRETYQH